MTQAGKIALRKRPEKTACTGAAEARDLEEPVTVLGPAHVGEEPGLGLLVVTGFHGVLLDPMPEVVTGHGEDSGLRKTTRKEREVHDPGAHGARPVHENADPIRRRLRDAEIHGACG